MNWRDTGICRHKGGGISYFRLRTGFSINESAFPNIHVGWNNGLFFYLAISPKIKIWWPRS